MKKYLKSFASLYNITKRHVNIHRKFNFYILKTLKIRIERGQFSKKIRMSNKIK